MRRFRELMGAQDEFVPLLQVIHLSDPHFGPSQTGVAASGRQAASRVGRLGAWIAANSQGFAGHDADALFHLERTLRRIVTATRRPGHRFQRCPFLLVVTGDLSTWGDDASIGRCMERLTALADGVGLEPPVFIYGNHDVWPGVPGKPEGHPAFVRDERELDARRSRLRDPETGVFPETWPRQFDRHTVAIVPEGHLTVHSLNTVRHGRVENALALGSVGPDRYWEGLQGPPQHALLADGCAPGVRIVLTHHPIHDPSAVVVTPQLPLAAPTAVQRPLRGLVNAREVAASLRVPQQETEPAWHRRVQVVLSGHTHETFPEFGKLRSARVRWHPPLDAHQVQLTAGTVCQSAWTASAKPQEWQLLRFSISAEDEPVGENAETRLRIERSVFTRPNCAGAFVARALPSRETFEQLDLEVR